MLPGRILYIWIDIVSTVFVFLVPFFAPPSDQSLQIEAPKQTESHNALLIWQDDSPATLVSSTLSSVSPPYPLSALSPVPSLRVLKMLESVSSSSSWLIIESPVLKSTPQPLPVSTISLTPKATPVISSSLTIPPKNDDSFNTKLPILVKFIYITFLFTRKLYLMLSLTSWYLFLASMATVTIELLDFEQMILLFTFAAFIMRCVWIIVYHKREPVIPETPLSKFTSGKWNPGLEAYVWYRVSDFKRRKERRKRKEAGAWKRARHGAEVQRKWAARRAAAARATGQSTALVPYHIQFVDNAVRQENPVKIV